MKRLMMFALAMATGLALAGCGDDDNGPNGPSNTGPIVFVAQMTAANEVPPVTNAESNARGTATVTMNVTRDSAGVPSADGTVTIAAQLSNFAAGTPVILGHIHVGAAGATGGPVVNTNLTAASPLFLADGTANTTFSNLPLPVATAQAIYNNPAGYYVNFHTQLNPGGAVRGQLVRQQ